MRKLAALLALLIGIGAMPAAQAQMRPGSAEDIGNAVRSCVQAVSADGVDERVLEAAGFQKAQASRDGKPIDTPVAIFGSASGRAIIMVPQGASPQGCVVTARIDSAARYPAVVDALSQFFGRSFGENASERNWRHQDRIIQLAPTGSAEAPGVRVIVIATQEEQE